MSTSRQYRWQQKRIAEGRCSRCGAPRKHYKVLCDRCQYNQRLQRRKRSGNRPWQKGKPGRPPKILQPPKAARR